MFMVLELPVGMTMPYEYHETKVGTVQTRPTVGRWFTVQISRGPTIKVSTG